MVISVQGLNLFIAIIIQSNICSRAYLGQYLLKGDICSRAISTQGQAGNVG